MRARRIPYHAVFLACTAIVCTSVAKAQVTALHIVSRPAPADILPGYVVNDLFIDFTGQYTGSQMIVELTSGEIYHEPTYGSSLSADKPPNAARFASVPALQLDTFVANGGPTDADTIGDFSLGGAAINIRHCAACLSIAPVFDDERINQSWNPAGGNVIVDRSGFMVARVTLSDDATGSFKYIAAANQVIGVAGYPPDGIVSRPIRNGFIIPEPSTMILLGFALVAAMVSRWRGACKQVKWRSWLSILTDGSAMRVRSIASPAILGAFAVAAWTSTAQGQVTALHIVSRPAPADILPGYVVNDLLIDFTGQLTGSQMIVDLTSGSIYQNSLGGITPPVAAIIPAVPAVEWDSFLANGGATAETTIGRFGPGGGICPLCPPTFTEESIEQSWNPAGGNVIVDRSGFMVARVTLSEDATGTFQYLAGANNVIGVAGYPPDGIVSRPIRNGFIIPEPSTVALLAVGLAVALVAFHRADHEGRSYD